MLMFIQMIMINIVTYLSLSLSRAYQGGFGNIWWKYLIIRSVLRVLHLLGWVHCQVKGTWDPTRLFASPWLVGFRGSYKDQDFIARSLLLGESAGFRLKNDFVKVLYIYIYIILIPLISKHGIFVGVCIFSSFFYPFWSLSRDQIY